MLSEQLSSRLSSELCGEGAKGRRLFALVMAVAPVASIWPTSGPVDAVMAGAN